jgi:hypothetical protein
VAFQTVVKAAANKLGKGGVPASKVAGAANRAAKVILGEGATAAEIAKEAVKLLNANFEKYKKEVGL